MGVARALFSPRNKRARSDSVDASPHPGLIFPSAVLAAPFAAPRTDRSAALLSARPCAPSFSAVLPRATPTAPPTISRSRTALAAALLPGSSVQIKDESRPVGADGGGVGAGAGAGTVGGAAGAEARAGTDGPPAFAVPLTPPSSRSRKSQGSRRSSRLSSHSTSATVPAHGVPSAAPGPPTVPDAAAGIHEDMPPPRAAAPSVARPSAAVARAAAVPSIFSRISFSTPGGATPVHVGARATASPVPNRGVGGGGGAASYSAVGRGVTPLPPVPAFAASSHKMHPALLASLRRGVVPRTPSASPSPAVSRLPTPSAAPPTHAPRSPSRSDDLLLSERTARPVPAADSVRDLLSRPLLSSAAAVCPPSPAVLTGNTGGAGGVARPTPTPAAAALADLQRLAARLATTNAALAAAAAQHPLPSGSTLRGDVLSIGFSDGTAPLSLTFMHGATRSTVLDALRARVSVLREPLCHAQAALEYAVSAAGSLPRAHTLAQAETLYAELLSAFRRSEESLARLTHATKD